MKKKNCFKKQKIKKKVKKLERINIYFWEGFGSCLPANSKFRIEVVENGQIFYKEGTPSHIRTTLRYLEYKYNKKFPKVSWKDIIGDDDGGINYHWSCLNE